MTDSAILHQAHNYTVLCCAVVYSIVAIEVITTSFIFKFLEGSGGGNSSFPHLCMKHFRSLVPRNVKD